MEFTSKPSFVVDVSTTKTSIALCYLSVVLRDSVRLAFLVPSLNDLDVFVCDIGNKYLNAPWKEKIWFDAEVKCVQSSVRKLMNLGKQLYSLKSSGTS